jgi:uncharacterized protein YjiS (DUF1127 family)
MANQLSANASSERMISPHSATRLPTLHRIYQESMRIRQVLSEWQRRCRDRSVLRSLSPQSIRDFCPRLTEAEAEMNKPFWQE